MPGASFSGRGPDRLDKACGAGSEGPRSSQELIPAATAWPSQVRGPSPASVGGRRSPARPALAGSKARGRRRERSPRPAASLAFPQRPVPFRPHVPAGSSPSRRRPLTSGLPLPRPRPLAAGPRGLLCPPLTRQARAGRSRSLGGARLSAPRPRPLLPAPPSPQLPGSRAATLGARRAPAPLRGAYLTGGGCGLGGCYRGGCSKRNRASGWAEGGTARTAAARTRPNPARRDRRAPPLSPPRTPPRAGPGSPAPASRHPYLPEPSVPAADACAHAVCGHA